MSTGSDRYHVKAAAGWSRTRTDGSAYAPTTDDDAEAAERWFANTYGGIYDDSISLRGDHGYDVAVLRRGVSLLVDVIHAGRLPNGQPRPAHGSNVIVNPDSNKLVHAHVLVYVEGPPFVAAGWIYTARFVALAEYRDFGYGHKLSLEARKLFPMSALGIAG